MRTTLTLDPDVTKSLKALMAEKGLTLKQAVNDGLRAGLTRARQDTRVKFRVEPHSCRFKPGVDLDKLNQLVDELESESSRKGLAK